MRLEGPKGAPRAPLLSGGPPSLHPQAPRRQPLQEVPVNSNKVTRSAEREAERPWVRTALLTRHLVPSAPGSRGHAGEGSGSRASCMPSPAFQVHPSTIDVPTHDIIFVYMKSIFV